MFARATRFAASSSASMTLRSTVILRDTLVRSSEATGLGLPGPCAPGHDGRSMVTVAQSLAHPPSRPSSSFWSSSSSSSSMSSSIKAVNASMAPMSLSVARLHAKTMHSSTSSAPPPKPEPTTKHPDSSKVPPFIAVSGSASGTPNAQPTASAPTPPPPPQATSSATETSSQPSSARAVTPEQYCMDLVKKNDYEHYLETLLLPKRARDVSFAVRALNVEVARVSDVTTSKHAGRIRLQFWLDAVAAAAKQQGTPHHPVAQALQNVYKTQKLTSRWVSRLIEERTKLLDDKPFGTLQDVETYGENTYSGLLYLTLESMGIQSIQADHAASHVGKAEAIVTLLRATPANASNRRVYLPMELTAKHGVVQEDVVRGVNTKALQEVAYELASSAHVHLQTAQAMAADLPAGTAKVLLPAVPCAEFLERIQQADFNLFEPSLQQRNPMLPFSLFKHSWRKTF
ncbi:phytoene synthase [Capsaspora owczarzaki ATCC 30864]|uniref:Phytoene synthase n=1 Tax=Capsaspora owczarzaki (strain ATCC 30864) TaxID=595528 RepID=A0A0D2WP63_CAPO3|nr:phytoene synthase [Capsaspora owczarzaki ATCC 30864]KJE92383.1 phytoene synthase [Capsaspora owczarzaki ATCC 30864]|eukprot:XP_004364202.2 phytoene synthase [Capsaspora owczarzaki ATCC 30864]